MQNLELSKPLLGFIVSTRAALAFGVGLLVADHIPPARRQVVARSLIAFGALTTIPAAIALFGRRDHSTSTGTPW